MFAVVPVPQLIAQPLLDKSANQPRKKLLLLGNVDYDVPPATAVSSIDNGRIRLQPDLTNFRSGSPGTLHFGPLLGTESEIAAIEEICRNAFGAEAVTPLRKSQAGKEVFLAEAHRHDYLHLATHGFFIPERAGMRPSGSHDARGNIRLESLTYNGPEAGATYPALLSGLAFAGANRAAQQQPSPPGTVAKHGPSPKGRWEPGGRQRGYLDGRGNRRAESRRRAACRPFRM